MSRPELRAIWVRRIRPKRAAILTGAAMTLGWLFATSAIAQLVRPDVVWRASAGLYLVSLGGWKLLYTIASAGLYKLSRSARG